MLHLRYPLLLFWVFFLLVSTTTLFAQGKPKPDDLIAQLEQTTDQQVRYGILYELTVLLTDRRSKEAPEYGEEAHRTARQLNSKQLTADAAWITAKAYARLRNRTKTDQWYRYTIRDAKAANDDSTLLLAYEARADEALGVRKFQRAADIYREAFEFLTEDGREMGSIRAKARQEASELAIERKALQRQREALADELEILREEQEILEEENDQLMAASENKTQELRRRDAALKEVTEAKAELDQKIVSERAKVDQLSRESMAQELTVKRAEAELKAKEAEAREAELRAAQAELISAKSETLRNMAIAAGMILLLLSGLLYYRFVSKRKAANALEASNNELADAQKKSDDLLLNILPATIAEELKVHGEAKARKFNDTTILFSDFVNFTKISEQLGPEQLVRELDVCFKAFDDIINDYPNDVEKIKTIGDAYMVASGLDNRKSVPANLVRAALRMQAYLEQRGKERTARGLPYFQARIGLHTGPVVAGVVGKKKFAYDVWGDTVNTASRVENQSEAGRVNVSETTYRLIKYQFDCEYRGKVQAKNKGYLDMYFVNGQL
ncbi:MAG: adenylate/guanylate cyclase domain-containing protein [Bacteroidota bacterium]